MFRLNHNDVLTNIINNDNVFVRRKTSSHVNVCYGCIFKTWRHFWWKCGMEELLKSTFSPLCISEICFKISKPFFFINSFRTFFCSSFAIFIFRKIINRMCNSFKNYSKAYISSKPEVSIVFNIYNNNG